MSGLRQMKSVGLGTLGVLSTSNLNLLESMLARLAEEVAALSLTHLSTKMDTDLAKLEKYFEEKQDHHNRQVHCGLKRMLMLAQSCSAINIMLTRARPLWPRAI